MKITLAYLVGVLLSWVKCNPLPNLPLVLLISFDGFRWDYLHMHNLSNFNYLKSIGSHAEFINNSFSTVTFPNHWTLVTGLYEETHGIVQNSMYDPELNKTFSYVVQDTQTHEWFGQNKNTEPIWTTNQKNGFKRYSAAEWVGANVVFENQKHIYIPYNHSASYYRLIDQFVGFFVDPVRPINFGALYFDEPDHVGHLYGPYSNEMKIQLYKLNEVLGYLIDQLRKYDLFDRLNLVITSDHGMEQISENTTIFLDSYVDTSLFEAFGSRACYSLFMKNEADLDKVYQTLKSIEAIDTYKKHEIPDELYYKNNVRIGDIVIVTKLGHAVYIKNESIDWTLTNGDHGYYNKESSMHPIFIAHGPAFKKNFQIETFKNVDIYPLICYILEIVPGVNNGTLDVVKNMLIKYSYDEMISTMVFALLTSVLFSALIFLILTKFKRRHDHDKYPNDYSDFNHPRLDSNNEQRQML